MASPYEGLIRDGDEWLFDNKLFGIEQKEASQLDPLARMLLTCAHETLGRRKEGSFRGVPVQEWRKCLPGSRSGAEGLPACSLTLARDGQMG